MKVNSTHVLAITDSKVNGTYAYYDIDDAKQVH